MTKAKKTALITDFDNTLFDWVDLWLTCFPAMLDGIAEISGLPHETLIPEIKAVHRKHGTSEYAYLIDELPSLQPLLKGRLAADVFAQPIKAYRALRREHLQLYPTVAETLLKVKGRGARIIVYTESMAFYSNYRVRCLGLDGVIDHLFCPEDHILPENLTPTDEFRYTARFCNLTYSKQLFTPKGSKKPDTQVLESIIHGLGLSKERCVYVGDNLHKDVGMALDCGVTDCWASYGQAHKRPRYKLLQDVTHWTDEDVAREQRIKERVDVHPTHELKQFSDVLGLFEFEEFP